MKLKWNVICMVAGGVVMWVAWGAPSYAFMGDYISSAPGDKAVVATVKNSDIGYDSDDIDAGDIDRSVFSIGLSKSVSPPAKVFGSLNYAFAGELGGGGADLDAGYSISAGGSYNFLDRETYSTQAYGWFNYIFEETFTRSSADVDISLDGYELILGVMGTIKVNPQLHIYGAFQLVPLSRFKMESTGSIRDSWDLEREVMFGLKGGLLYDFRRWFAKGEVEIGSERAFSLLAGMKF